MSLAVVLAVLTLCCGCGCGLSPLPSCSQDVNCHLPDCFCPTLSHPLFPDVTDIPQMVYFGFDDALTSVVDEFYQQLFTKSRKNPNGCPITMSLYVDDQYTEYNLVEQTYRQGNEIGSHSVTHTNVDTRDKLLYEAGTQKDNIVTKGHVPRKQVVGWRSPNLKPAGNAQPEVLQQLNYTYDISLTYTTASANDPLPWPYTLDFGYPYPCDVTPCPGRDVSVAGWWEVPVSTLWDPVAGQPCAYVDSCRPNGQQAAFNYLWSNFQKVYHGNRAPFGLNMHAAFFFYPGYLTATLDFLDTLLAQGDVYVISVSQVLDWMRSPVKVSEAGSLPGWGCEDIVSPAP